jgi:hypothetical protein
MIIKTKIEFNELAKSVSATTKIEVEEEYGSLSEYDYAELLRLNKNLSDEALEYSKLKTMQKNI